MFPSIGAKPKFSVERFKVKQAPNEEGQGQPFAGKVCAIAFDKS